MEQPERAREKRTVIVECQNLTKRFRRHDAVMGLNLNVPEGAALALVGSNGAGKSTTLRLLLNIIAPDEGTARVLGVDARKLTPEVLQHIGYVCDNPTLPDRLNVSQYYDYLRALYPNWDTAYEQALRKRLDLPAFQIVGRLSHGMRMKLLLVGALAFHPKLLVLDEPLSGLDPLMRDEVLEGILGQAGETTIVISSHELTELEGFATQIAFIDQGRLLFHEDIEHTTARFREVSVTLPQAANGPPRLHSAWLAAETTGAVMRFVESQFTNEQEFAKKASAHLGDFRHLETRAMSLREISKALMRANRAGQSS
jgi:ABC-2 type transport system ATP-binding protein